MLLRNPTSPILKSWTSLSTNRSAISKSFSCCHSPESGRHWKQSAVMKDDVKVTCSFSPDSRMLSVGDGGCGGRIGRGGGSGGNSGSSDKNMDAYYQKMIESDPSNPLFLGNYAKFLKEVQHNLAKAQKYCERAILLNPGDGDVLSMYADLIWKRTKDAERAEAYFDRAVRVSPKDCSVAASYAQFLWEVEETEESEECHETGFSQIASPSISAAS